jgi:DNA-directed RNA polymerase subunit RPC12/RpoP
MCKEIREKFQELYSLNVNQYVEKKNDLSYLSWSYAWAEFKKIYPDATYEVKKDAEGRCYFGDELFGYMVYTSVTAGGLTYEMWLPVMDGANKTMKALPYKYTTFRGEKTVEAMTMFDVNKTVMRCLVKNLAMFGLGLYIYAGEDLPQDIKEYVCADCGKPVDSNMAQRTHKAFGTYLCKECGLERSKKKEEG